MGLTARPLAPDAWAALARHTWPGNVRAREAALTQAMLLAEGPLVTRADLRLDASAAPAADSRGPWDGVSTLEEVIQGAVRAAWEEHNRNQSRAAAALGIDRSTFRAKLGVVDEQPRGRPRRKAPV